MGVLYIKLAENLLPYSGRAQKIYHVSVHYGFRKHLSLGRPNPVWSHFWISLCQPYFDMLLLPDQRVCLWVSNSLVGRPLIEGLHLRHGLLLEERGSLHSSR